MTYAIIKEGIVDNVADSTHPLGPLWIEVPIGASVAIGDTYLEEMFFDPEGNIRLTPEQKMANKIIEDQKIEIENLKSALTEAQQNNSILTDCILEMSEIIYA